MNIISEECHIKSQLELFFKLCCDCKETEDAAKRRNDFYERLKDESKIFLGLYHYSHNRDQMAFEIFSSIAMTTTETVETYYAWYMIGQCYNLGIIVKPDKDEAHEWFKKAADKGIPVACAALGMCYQKSKMFEKAVDAYERAFNYGFSHTAVNIFKIYMSETSIKDINKAYYWSTKADKLDSLSHSLLGDILATGQFEWTQQHHQYWSHLRIKFVMEKTVFGKESSIVSHYITFMDQVFVILLISKFRAKSNFEFTKLLTKDVSISVIKQLAHVWIL